MTGQPDLLVDWLLLIAAVAGGLALLTWSADQFVIGAARLAVALRVSAVVIGAVVVGFGTSAPELLVSALSAGQGKLDIAVGNIVGSNVANLSLVLGVAALIAPMSIDSRVLRREAPICAAAVVTFAVLGQGGIARWQGVVLLLGLVLALGLILRTAKDGGDSELIAEVEELFEEEPPHSLRFEVARTIGGLLGTLAGAQVLLEGAVGIADRAGLQEGFVGLTLVALGTSLPELVTAIQSARRGEHDLIAGNLLGSNVFNSLAVGGVAGLIGPGALDDPDIAGIGSIFMVGLVLATWWFMRTGRKVVRWEAGILLATYFVAVPLLA